MPRKRKRLESSIADNRAFDKELKHELVWKFKVDMMGFYFLFHLMNDNEIMLEQMRNELEDNWWLLVQSLVMKDMVDADGDHFIIKSKGVRFVLLFANRVALN